MRDKREFYQKPSIEVIELDSTDVITTSGDGTITDTEWPISEGF